MNGASGVPADLPPSTPLGRLHAEINRLSDDSILARGALNVGASDLAPMSVPEITSNHTPCLPTAQLHAVREADAELGKIGAGSGRGVLTAILAREGMAAESTHKIAITAKG